MLREWIDSACAQASSPRIGENSRSVLSAFVQDGPRAPCVTVRPQYPTPEARCALARDAVLSQVVSHASGLPRVTAPRRRAQGAEFIHVQ